jgi:hypothetical protein
MKNRILITALLLISAASLVKAQGSAASKEIVTLPDGGFVSFKNEAMWSELRQAIRLRQLPAPLNSQVLADHNQIVHRVLRDRDGRFVFGYDLWVTGDATTRRFSVAVKPLAAELASSLRADASLGAEGSSTFPKSTEPQTLDDGAEFSLDLLINKTTGVKIVDVVKVSFDRGSLGGDIPARARDFTLDAVAMEMKDFSLMMNDELIGTGKSKTGSSGALLWLYVPQRGRFIFSLAPRADYGFEKVGTVSANKIEFSFRGERYEWLSSSPILREEGTWNLWVLSDPRYVPMMGVNIEPPPKEKTSLEKLEDKVSSVMQKSPSPVSVPAKNALQQSILDKMEKNSAVIKDDAVIKENNAPRSKVMFGAADRIENLLPRN